MRLGLFQPDIPQNVGAAMRLTGCLGVALDVILPCAFNLDDKAMKRAALDYGPLAHVTRHATWTDFMRSRAPGRLVLMTTKAEHLFPNFDFRADDTILLGSESSGVPPEVHDIADARLRIPLVAGARSLNVVTTGAMALGEALRQTGGYPPFVKRSSIRHGAVAQGD
jgi:tRNA (cytidine/uridine-2'-O-)-methyltransferase